MCVPICIVIYTSRIMDFKPPFCSHTFVIFRGTTFENEAENSKSMFSWMWNEAL
jgi:hypothetical protein